MDSHPNFKEALIANPYPSTGDGASSSSTFVIPSVPVSSECPPSSFINTTALENADGLGPLKYVGLPVKIPAKGVTISDVEQVPDKVFDISAPKNSSLSGKGKGKDLFVAGPVPDDSSDDEALVLIPPISPPGIEHGSKKIVETGEKVPLVAHPAPTRVYVSSALIDASKYIPLSSSDGSPLCEDFGNAFDMSAPLIEHQLGEGFDDLSPGAIILSLLFTRTIP
ncbi:hypothetical protein BVRB_004650 [Beta vulgaris subsp. vulgaris]|uniref:Uncharacterized protein n=1 Tax=Beta vulgaris subsp. vulgaris TaxID=3555 RepID=A0A0J8B7P0_BETVV|nr:hypothetical protein BVRB_004650 [Beta vulgaris subsp. vulgaris]